LHRSLGSEGFGPLVADDHRVYTARGEGVIALDAATGRIAATLRTKHAPAHLAYLENVLLAS
jgi:hypothetical protein